MQVELQLPAVLRPPEVAVGEVGRVRRLSGILRSWRSDVRARRRGEWPCRPWLLRLNREGLRRPQTTDAFRLGSATDNRRHQCRRTQQKAMEDFNPFPEHDHEKTREQTCPHGKTAQ